jgi:hypothetical protein
VRGTRVNEKTARKASRSQLRRLQGDALDTAGEKARSKNDGKIETELGRLPSICGCGAHRSDLAVCAECMPQDLGGGWLAKRIETDGWAGVTARGKRASRY